MKGFFMEFRTTISYDSAGSEFYRKFMEANLRMRILHC